LAKLKAQGLDGIVPRFYVRLWHIINKDYFNMVKIDVPIGRFHKGVKKFDNFNIQSWSQVVIGKLVANIIFKHNIQNQCQNIIIKSSTIPHGTS
jgi:hypothetical protein